MSVDINWETLTGGPDGQELAETIREFVNDRFQQTQFPKLIRSVKVHAFDFGSVAPDITLKDVCNPLPDFYDTQDEAEDGLDDAPPRDGVSSPPLVQTSTGAGRNARPRVEPRRPSDLELLDQSNSPTLTRGALLGSTSNFSYFNLPGFSGTATPLAAVAGAHFQNGLQPPETQRENSESFGSVSPPSTASLPSRPVSRDFDSRVTATLLDVSDDRTEQAEIEPNPDDLQVVFHVTYSGDIRLSMTAEVFLDYPMPSFVGIPLKLNITGMTFNGVGILAYIKKRAHLCFLSPEDAEALVGSESAAMSPGVEEEDPTKPSKVGALLEEIKIETEMGDAGEGKQVLKNVGKIEKFILEQVRSIFEEEFVYPSFWTFLV